jgi:hypothetical protein
MRRRTLLPLSAGFVSMLPAVVGPARADASHPNLASYYGRHAALVDGVVYGWDGRGAPRALRAGIYQVAVSRDAWYGVTGQGDLLRWTDAEPARAWPPVRRDGSPSPPTARPGRRVATMRRCR